MKKENVKKIAVTSFLAVGLAASLCYFWLGRDAPPPDETAVTTLPSRDAPETVETDYILETCFDGSKELNPLLFHFPFQKGNEYVMNKELVQKVDESRICDLTDRATEAVCTMFGISASDAVAENEKYEELLKDYLSDDCGFYDENGKEYSADDYISDFLLLLSQSGIQMDIEYTTDKSLVFEDDAYYVRGLLNMTVYDMDSDVDVTGIFPVQLEKGKSYVAVLDTGLVPDISRRVETYKICDLDWVYCEEDLEKGQGEK